MTREEVFERLNEVFRDVFDDETIKVKDTTTADDIEDMGFPGTYQSGGSSGEMLWHQIYHGRGNRNEKCGGYGRYYPGEDKVK